MFKVFITFASSVSFRFISVIILLLAVSAHSEVHKWVDNQGRVHYSDEKPNDQDSEVLEIIEPMTFEHTSVYDVPDFLGFFSTPEQAGKKRVVMYSTERCGYCKKAKRYFESNNIAYKEKDINKSKQYRKEWNKLGGSGVPVILVGKKKIHGFDLKTFERYYY